MTGGGLETAKLIVKEILTKFSTAFQRNLVLPKKCRPHTRAAVIVPATHVNWLED